MSSNLIKYNHMKCITDVFGPNVANQTFIS